MTNTQTHTSDLRTLLASALSQGGGVLAAVRPEQYDLPTPCAEMTVRALMDHLVGVAGRIATLGETGGFGELELPAVDEWSRAYAAAAGAALEAWANPAALERTITVPWGEMSGARTLATYVSEVLVHTWDLATATGQHVAWDEEVAAASLTTMQAELPAEGREHAPFDPVVEVNPDAPAIERLVAWTGRRP